MAQRRSEAYKAVKAALRKLSRSGRRTPDQIAAHLEKAGIKGLRNEGSSCPVYHYLRLNNVPCLRVTRSYFLVPSDDWRGDLPRNVAGFVRGFDAGHYPELDALQS